jgi:hypothetical protein
VFTQEAKALLNSAIKYVLHLDKFGSGGIDKCMLSDNELYENGHGESVYELLFGPSTVIILFW